MQTTPTQARFRPRARFARPVAALLCLPVLAPVGPAAAESAGGIAWNGAISAASPSWVSFGSAPSAGSGAGAFVGAGGPAVCATAIAAAEARHRLPSGLLAAIGAVESGRLDAESQAIVAWPWSINAEGDGQQFAAKADAIARVTELQTGGMQSIDVGCMQVNLRWHPDAFADLEQAFDPAANADYAARLLTELYQQHGNWRTAVGYYHSPTDWRQANYTAKVSEAWAAHGGSFGTLPVAVAAANEPPAPDSPEALFGGMTASAGAPSTTAAVDGPGVDLGPSPALVSAARTITAQGGTAGGGGLRFFPLPPRRQ